jgi:nicotinic acetylcholine receptor
MLPLIVLLSSLSGNSEYSLKNDLFANYRNDILPLNGESSIHLEMGVAFRAFNSIDQVEGTLTANIWLRHWWVDNLLTWDPKDYGNITDISVNTDPGLDHTIWIPDMYLYNTAELPMENLDYSRAHLYKNGLVSWSRPGIIKSTCKFDLEYFPYDTQHCYLKFGSWVYHKEQLNISVRSGDNAIDISNYQENDGWELKNYSTEYSEVKYKCCPEIYPDIKYQLTLRRKPGYYTLNIITPTYATSALMIISLIVPWDSGERISFAITVMLSLIVFLLILSENLPKTDTKPLLSRMLVGLTFFSLFVVFFTVIISALYSYKTNKKNVIIRLYKYFRPDEEDEEDAIVPTQFQEETNNSTGQRTNSYNNATSKGDIVINKNEDSDSITSTKSENKYKIMASNLESIFTVIFFFGFIIYSAVMFSFIPD